MVKHLPYRATTAGGERLSIDFPLHAETASPIRVAAMLSAILAALDAEVRVAANTGNGDVLQALAMALAIRAAMIAAPKRLTDRLAVDLLATALAATDEAEWQSGPRGHA